MLGENDTNMLLVCSPKEKFIKIINKTKSYACKCNYFQKYLVHLKFIKFQCHTLKSSSILGLTTSTIINNANSSLFNLLLSTLSYFSINIQQVSSF